MSIFEFSNYREFLRSYVRSLPKSGHGELTRIASHLRISTTMLSQILSGQRDFNTDQAFELSEYLQLTEIETDYLYLLVEVEKAGTHKNKSHFRKKIEAMKSESLKLSKRVQHEKSLTDNERSVFYSSWIYPAVHLFLGLDKRGVSLEEICERFSISRQKASDLVQFFLRTGLAKEERGKYFPGVQSTFIEQGSPHLIKHHSNWRVKAIEKSESIADEELMFTAPLSISKKDFTSVREKIAQFIKTLSEIVKESEAEDIATINIDWFWVKK